jgi:pimeloyl-ACP methyl ester carboxylesterase
MRPSLAVVLALTACGTPGLMPLTVEDDMSLPRIEVTVDNRPRLLHLLEWGDPRRPTVLIVHGSVSDVRSWLPIAEGLASEYHVVAWDLGGNGLSQRLERRQLAFDLMADEVLAVKARVSPTAPVAVIGHSWGASIVALALGRQPAAFSRVVLAEPPGLTGELQNRVGAAVNLMVRGYLDMAVGAGLLAPVDHEGLDLRALEMLSSGTRAFSCPGKAPTPVPVWRPGGLALIEWETSVIGPSGAFSYDFTPGLADVEAPVLLIGTECSVIGAEFQRTGNLPLLRQGSLVSMAGVSHRLTVEDPSGFVGVVKTFLGQE